mmetsp:Transcript_97932/g.227088  ORF Transcript_97932/g.227088 Transcript_97932/m.227088 type:complete len:360 (-) Transcript_97932:125-1204(-)
MPELVEHPRGNFHRVLYYDCVGACGWVGNPRQQSVGVHDWRRRHFTQHEAFVHIRGRGLRESQQRRTPARIQGRLQQVVVGLHQVPDARCAVQPLHWRRAWQPDPATVHRDDGAFVGSGTRKDEVVRCVEVGAVEGCKRRIKVRDFLQVLPRDPWEVLAAVLSGIQVLPHVVLNNAGVRVETPRPVAHASVDAEAANSCEELHNGLATLEKSPVEDPDHPRPTQVLWLLHEVVRKVVHLVVNVPAVDHCAILRGGQQTCALEAGGVDGVPHVREHHALQCDCRMVHGLHDALVLGQESVVNGSGIHPPRSHCRTQPVLEGLSHRERLVDDRIPVLQGKIVPALLRGQVEVDDSLRDARG